MKRDAGMNDFVSGLTQAARDNPLAAALIGGGALWLLLGNRPIGLAASGLSASAHTVAEKGMQATSYAADALTSAGSRVAEAASDVGRRVGGAAASTSSAVKERLQGAADGARDQFDRQSQQFAQAGERLNSANMMPPLRDGFANARTALTDLLERQPLVLGALGIAIGAGVANAIRMTALENEMTGSFSDELKDEIKERAGRAAASAQRVAGDIGNEFRSAASEAADILKSGGKDSARGDSAQRQGEPIL